MKKPRQSRMTTGSKWIGFQRHVTREADDTIFLRPHGQHVTVGVSLEHTSR